TRLRNPESTHSRIRPSPIFPRNGPFAPFPPSTAGHRHVMLWRLWRSVPGPCGKVGGKLCGSRMDNLTHSLAGASLAAAGLRRTTPLATSTLVVAANAPDVDAFIYLFRDEYYALAFRRGYTHGPVAIALLPFVVAGVMLAWDRFVRC